MENLIKKFLDDMYRSYVAWNTNTPSPEYEAERNERFKNGLSFSIGKKYIKIISNGGSVHAFIVNTDNDDKFRRGDVLMPAGWKTPARNSPRGNILDGYTANHRGVARLKH
jgi:hypothetical protein|tara:strand:+ start:33 stop:365 length:333 start_codon:yes stop_codon:yes gene_type:complete